MIRILGIIVILIFTTSYNKPTNNFLKFEDCIVEIKDNLDAAKKDLEEVKLIISDPKRLDEIKEKKINN